MPTYVKVRSLQRRARGLRISSALAAQNAVTLSQGTSVVVDLDDPKTRADVAHHSSIGQLVVVGSAQAQRATTAVTVVQQGVLATRSLGTLNVSVTGGTLLKNDNSTVAVSATTVTAGAAPVSGWRIDLIQVHTTTGAVTLKAGTSAVTGAVAPAADASNIGVAEVWVKTGTTYPTLVNDVRPLP